MMGYHCRYRLQHNDGGRRDSPGYSLHSKYLSDVLGKKFVKDVSKGERFSFELIDNRFKMLAASDRSSDFVLRQAGIRQLKNLFSA